MARPNTHGVSISTWDVRASSLALGLTKAMSGAAKYQALSAVANFSSTSGFLSAQFGLHYLNFQEDDADAPEASGASLGGAALFHFPWGGQLSSGLPPGALNLYVGGQPTMIVGVERNYLSLPLAFGAGLTWTPTARFSVTPWAELSRSVNLDTRLQAVDTQTAVEAAQNGQLTREDVETLVRDGLALEVVSHTATRWGINASVHMTPRIDLDVNMMLGTGSVSNLGLGVALVIRWDQFVGSMRQPSSKPDSTRAPRDNTTNGQTRPLPSPRRRVPAIRRRPRFRQLPGKTSLSPPPSSNAEASKAPRGKAAKAGPPFSSPSLKVAPRTTPPPRKNKAQNQKQRTRIRTRRRPRLRVIPQP